HISTTSCSTRASSSNLSVFLFHCSSHHRDLHSFPTRRSSDLTYKRGPIEMARGEGVYLIDTEGNRYLDFVSGIAEVEVPVSLGIDRKSTRLNSSHVEISYAVFCLKKKKNSKM